MSTAAAHGLPVEPLETLGGGVMEWRRDRDRHLQLHSGFVSRASGAAAGPGSAAEVLNLAAVLTRQSLPMTHKVSSEAGKTL